MPGSRAHRVVQRSHAVDQRAELEPVGLALGPALRVARADCRDDATAADALRGGVRVGERRGRPQGGARDERADLHAARLGRDRAEQREALERGPPVRRIAAPQMVVDEHAVETGRFGRARDTDRYLGVVDERREREADVDGHASSVRASTAAPTAPARSPSSAGMIAIGGR